MSMAKNKKRQKKFDVRKKRAKILKERRKKLPKQDKQEIVKGKTEKEQKLEIRLEKETKLYWIRGVSGALSALVGRLFLGLLGWIMLLWMLFFWFIFPFIVNAILKYEYDKEEWTWKNVIKPGIGIFFFLFMIVGIFIHTLLRFV